MSSMGLGLGLGLGGGGGGGSAPVDVGSPTQTPLPDGYDLFTGMGDSLIPGRGNAEASRDPVLDADVPDTAQYVNASGQGNYQQLSTDTSPVWDPDGSSQARVTVHESVLREYQSLTSANSRRAGVIPCGVGGTRLIRTADNLDWDPAGPGDYLVNARNAHNAAWALYRAAYPATRMRGVYIALTSNDVAGGEYNSTNIRAAFIAICAYVRANFDGCSAETPIVLAGPCAAGSTYDTARADVAYAVTQVSNCYQVDPPTPTAAGDGLHPTMAENRIWGPDIAQAFDAADEPESVEAFSITDQSGVALNTVIVSAPFIVRGIGVGVSAVATVSGGEIRVNGGSWGTYATVWYGDEIEARVTSSALNSTGVTATVTITGPLGGGDAKQADFIATTISAGTTNLVSAAAGGNFDNGVLRFAADGFLQETL